MMCRCRAVPCRAVPFHYRDDVLPRRLLCRLCCHLQVASDDIVAPLPAPSSHHGAGPWWGIRSPDFQVMIYSTNYTSVDKLVCLFIACVTRTSSNNHGLLQESRRKMRLTLPGVRRVLHPTLGPHSCRTDQILPFCGVH